MTRRLPLPAAVVLLLFASALHAAQRVEPAGELTFDRWYVLEMQDQRAGWAHATVHEAEDRITTSMDMRLTIKRGGAELTIAQAMRFAETPEGDPLEADSTTDMGAMAVRRHFEFADDGIRMTATQGGQSRTQTLPAVEGDWLPPAAAQRLIEQRTEAGADRVELRTVDVSMGVTAVDVTMRRLGEQDVEVLGKVVPAVAWESRTSVMPGMTITEYIDPQGQMLRTTMQLGPGLSMQMIAADEQLAKAEVDPPELLAGTLIEPAGGPIDRPRGLRSAVYRVTIDQPADEPVEVSLPSTGYQRVVWGDERTATVVLDLDRPVAPQDDLPSDVHREASTTLNHEDERIRALLGEALGEDAEAMSDWEKAHRLREFVGGYVDEKNLSVGFATASEVARTREGDCTEHAVLLAALLRAADIPSRAAIGLVYVGDFLGREGVFGGHMWTQAWIAPPAGGAGESRGARWVDLDATLPTAFDAAHITQSTSALAGPALVNELVKAAPALGRLSIEVVGVEGEQ